MRHRQSSLTAQDYGSESVEAVAWLAASTVVLIGRTDKSGSTRRRSLRDGWRHQVHRAKCAPRTDWATWLNAPRAALRIG